MQYSTTCKGYYINVVNFELMNSVALPKELDIFETTCMRKYLNNLLSREFVCLHYSAFIQN